MHGYYCSNDSQTEQDKITSLQPMNWLQWFKYSGMLIVCHLGHFFTVFWRIVVPTSLGSVILLLFDCLTSKVKVLHSFEELGVIYPTTKHAIPEDLRNWSSALGLWGVWLDISLIFWRIINIFQYIQFSVCMFYWSWDPRVCIYITLGCEAKTEFGISWNLDYMNYEDLIFVVFRCTKRFSFGLQV